MNVAGSLVCAGLFGALVSSGFASERPNIILVITDDQGYGVVGANGHPWIETPHIDALHARSVSFERFLVSPTCAPTRSALMTGRHPMRNGVTHTILERERMTLDATTLPEVLASAGYVSGIFGKWHLGDEDAYQPGARGFDEVFIHGAGGIGQAYDCSCADAPGNRYFDPVVRHNGAFVKTEGFCTDVFFDAALGWMDGVRDGDAPFFAYISTNAPHGPFVAPPASRDRFEAMGFPDRAAGFYGMVENIDDNMGRLEAFLAGRGLHRDTVVIFMSDNGTTGAGAGSGDVVLGTTPGGDEVRPFNAGMRGMKGSVHEGGVRVPFLVRWDGRFEAGRTVGAVSAHIDLLPTLAELAGVDVSSDAFPRDQVEGRSLVPLLEGETAAPDRYLFTHRGRWPTGADPGEFKFEGCAVRSERFRWVDGAELYDMRADPGQTKNVIGDHPDVARAMAEAYDEWWAETVPLMVNEDAPMSEVRPFHAAFRAQEAAGGIPAWEAPDPGGGLFDFTACPAGGVQLVGDERHVMVPEGDAESQWTFEDGVLTASPEWDSVVTPEPYADFRMHVEFSVNVAPEKDRETRGNSGVYVQQRYEIQILDSHGVPHAELQPWDCASLYRLKKPDRAAARPAGEWQSYDIVFRAARFDGDEKTENARITVLHNGALVHDAVELPRKTGAGKPEGPDPMPIKLQGHHNQVRFRDVWIEPLELDAFPATPADARDEPR